MKMGGTSLFPRSSVSSAGTLAARLGQHRNSPKNKNGLGHRCCLSSASQGVPTPPSRSLLREQGGPWDEEGSGDSEGARKRTEDVAVDRPPAGPNIESKHPWGGRGGGPQGSSPSAAVRRFAPEEQAVGGL